MYIDAIITYIPIINDIGLSSNIKETIYSQ